MKPDDHRGFHNLGLALVNLGFADEAATQLKKALEIKPDYPDAFNTLGLAYESMSRKDDAEDCYRKAVALNPQFADAWSNLGTNLTEAGRSDEAIEALRKSVAAKPGAAQIHSNLLLTLNYTSRLTPAQVLDEHKTWAAKFVPASPLKALVSDPGPSALLNVGYLSADFRGHTVAGFIEQLLIHHDRETISRHRLRQSAAGRRDDRTHESAGGSISERSSAFPIAKRRNSSAGRHRHSDRSERPHRRQPARTARA